MRTCPHCGGQIRPSVIRCVHCGTSLDAGEATTPLDAGIGTADRTGGHPAPGSALASARTAEAPPTPRSVPDPWVTPPPRSDAQASLALTMRSGAGHAVPTKRWRADAALTGAAVLAAAAAVTAYSSLPLPWVRAELATRSDAPGVVADMTFRGSDAFAATVGSAIAVALLVLGLVWFWYALDRGMSLPVLGHPLLALLAVAVGVAVLAFSRLGYFFWDDAFVAHAREAGMTKAAMRDLLGSAPTPTIAVEPLGGVYRFGTALLLALGAGLVAWWSQRQRG